MTREFVGQISGYEILYNVLNTLDLNNCKQEDKIRYLDLDNNELKRVILQDKIKVYFKNFRKKIIDRVVVDKIDVTLCRYEITSEDVENYRYDIKFTSLDGTYEQTLENIHIQSLYYTYEIWNYDQYLKSFYKTYCLYLKPTDDNLIYVSHGFDLYNDKLKDIVCLYSMDPREYELKTMPV